MDWKANRR